MRRILTAFLLALCFSAASQEGAPAQERTKPSPRQGEAEAEAVGSLVSLLKNARAYTTTRTQTTQRLSGVRAEGCVLRYNVVMEYESPIYQPWDRPQSFDSSYRLTEREFTVDLSELDASGVRTRLQNQLKRKSGGSVLFRTLDGKESVRERWVQKSRFGTMPQTRWGKVGSFPSGDQDSLEGLAAALRRAIEACAAVSR